MHSDFLAPPVEAMRPVTAAPDISPIIEGQATKQRFFMTVLRAARLSWHLIHALLLACIFPTLSWRSQQGAMQRWSLKLLEILHVRLHAFGTENTTGHSAKLLVANHISWLDVFVINASTPARFVAKAEVSSWPLIGWLVRRSGTAFVKRERSRDTLRVNQVIEESLLAGEDMALFLQGTSTDGALPVRFRSSMLQGAIDAAAVLHPLVIVYHDRNGNRIDEVAFIGEMTLLASIWKILCLRSSHVSVYYVPGISCAGASRHDLAARAQDAVNAVLLRSLGP